MRLDIPAGPLKPDAEKIFELINTWDHRCPTPSTCPHRGAVTRFARRTGRHRQSFYNLRAPGKVVGPTFVTQIADTLRVSWRDITLPASEAAQTEDPQPQAEAA